MHKFKRNSRGYRLITTATKNNATTDNKYLQDTTPAEVSIQTQKEYIQLHDEITKEPDSTLLSPENPILEENRQKVLLDISSSVHFTNITTDTHENISTCTEVNDAFQNLIHMDDYESGSRFIDSAILNTTEHELPDVTQQEPEQSSFHQGNANLLSPIVNQSDNADTVFNPTTDMPVETENRNGRPKKGRKRKYPDQTREIRKKICQSNKKYISHKGKVVDSREFNDVQCKDGCHEKVTVTERKQEFSKFWELGFEGKCLYISCNVKTTDIKRKRNKNSNKRKCTRVYFLKNQIVCAKMFIDTLRISSARVHRYLMKCSSAEKIEDKRGISSQNNHKLSEEVKQSVIEHIDKFPKYTSHYRRAQTDRMILPPDITLLKMHELYLSETSCDTSTKKVSLASYKKIFYNNFNLQIKRPQKDTCNKCDLLAIKIRDATLEETKLNLERERDQHHKEAEDARAMKKQDLKLAKTFEHLETLTFDMEKTLPLPRIPTNIVFYKRQLWLYNCGVHSGKTGKGFCYVWVEGTAGRGAQEVGSSLRKHISLNLDSKVKELILWSDSCGGQNRNIKVTLLLFAVMEENENLEKITLRFMVPGHSFLENDSEFSDIESCLKTQTRLYTPQDYINVMTSCRKKNKLTAFNMEKDDFVGVSKMMKKIVNRKKDLEGNSVSWLKTKEISIFKNKPGRIFLSTTHGGHPQEVNLNKRPIRGQNCTSLSFSSLYEQLWPEGKPIAQPKLDDIKSLLHLIPSDARCWYEKLTGSRDVDEDVDDFNGPLDFDIEEE